MVDIAPPVDGSRIEVGWCEEITEAVNELTAIVSSGLRLMGQDLGVADVTPITTEQVCDTVTFTAVAGHRYLVLWQASWLSTVANDQADFRIRSTTGPTLTTGDVEEHRCRRQEPAANVSMDITLIRSIPGLTAGQVTVGTTCARNAGSGNLTVAGSATNIRVLEVYDVGLV